MMTIDRGQVLMQLEQLPGTPLVEVLPRKMFADYHLPGAVNVPVDDDDFDDRIQEVAPDRSAPVIVYCYDADCDASSQAASRMESLGYEQVFDYEAGKIDWKDAGLHVVS
jgi:rhodanese-related sulfurtransferase